MSFSGPRASWTCGEADVIDRSGIVPDPLAADADMVPGEPLEHSVPSIVVVRVPWDS